MRVLVAYSSKHGATEEIARRIAEILQAASLEIEVRRSKEIKDLTPYDAFIIGSAVYMFHWEKDAQRLVRRHRALLAERPAWLFSSGPLGTDTVDAEGRDVRETNEAREMAEFVEAIHPRGHAMFFGAYSPGNPKGLVERFISLMPAAKNAMPVGDFRDWDTIEAWARGIAAALETERARGAESSATAVGGS